MGGIVDGTPSLTVYRAGRTLCCYGLQPGANGEPVVVSDDTSRSVGVICLGRSAPKML